MRVQQPEQPSPAHRLLVPALVALALAVAACAGPTPGFGPFNVVVFVADDLGFMDIGANNPDTFYETPNIDALARRGMRFTQAYAPSSVCSPTRFSLLTGRYPSRVHATDWFVGTNSQTFLPAELTDRMPLEETTLAEFAQRAGYPTFFAGKWHLGPDAEYWPEAQGFDVNRGGHERGGPYGPGRYFTPYGNPRLADGPEGEHLPARLAQETSAFIEGHGDDPFLAYLSFYSVHTPLMAPEALVTKYEAKAERLGLELEDVFREEEQVWPDSEPRRVRVVQSHVTYAAMIEAMDDAVGTVIDALRVNGLLARTIIVFTSDNGGLSTSEGHPTSNVPLRGGKGWLYEGGIRVPFLIAWPGVAEPGSVSSVPVSTNDLVPTLVTGMGINPEDRSADPTIDGHDLRGALLGSSDAVHDALFWHYPHYSNQGGFPGGAVRIGNWKLIERYEDGRVHLYDVDSDPGELEDLSTHEPERVATMRARLHAWYRDVGARFLRQREGGAEPWRPGREVDAGGAP